MFSIYPTPEELAEACALETAAQIRESGLWNKDISIALSGGSTPKLLFKILAGKFGSALDWSHVHFFWGDERCVPPDDPESNYGMTAGLLLNRINVPPENIHRIRGEDDPVSEAARYSEEIKKHLQLSGSLPRFDIIMLGLGEDGHTASIFQGNLNSFSSRNICEPAVHPVSGQKRITLTGKVINNADMIFFLVSGESKSQVVRKILRKEEDFLNFPAVGISPDHGIVKWFLDEKAASFIK